MTASTPILAFPTPPSSNLVVSPPSQPLPPDISPSDSIIATSLLAATPLASSSPSFVGTPHKETSPPSELPPPIETAPVVELHETENIPEEVEGWLGKLNQAGDINLTTPITHDGDILLANSEAQVVKEKLVLPLTETQVSFGLKHQVTDSARWLAEWCVRLVKMVKDGIKYAPEAVRPPPEKHL